MGWFIFFEEYFAEMSTRTRGSRCGIDQEVINNLHMIKVAPKIKETNKRLVKTPKSKYRAICYGIKI